MGADSMVGVQLIFPGGDMTSPPVSGPVLDLLRRAHSGLAEATQETAPGARYVKAHLAALRAAAAVAAAKGQPATGRRRRPRSVWELLPEAVPALAEWAAYFAAGAGKRAAAEAGLPRAVTAREADDLLGEVETFLTIVVRTLGVEMQTVLPFSRSEV